MNKELQSKAEDMLEVLEEKMLVDTSLSKPICPLKHTFSDGVYIREITMPTGAVILGHKHNTRHMNIISKGACILVDIETGELTDIIAPYTFESDVGVRKLLYIIEECVWTTIHATDETDIDILESTLVTPSDTHKELEGGKKCLS